jgi:bifunctional enzyme CysN/CysC
VYDMNRMTLSGESVTAGAPSPSTRREHMNVVIVGHVDHGKSTVIGRLLADTDSFPKGKVEAVRETCARTGKPFEYAFLLDALKDEQAQGITIDAARVFFRSALRDYQIIDAPGHNEFLKNMITGASRAQAALLVIDAAEGIRENSRRHGTMLSRLGIAQVVILVNKMDLVGWKQATFEELVRNYATFLDRLGVHGARFIPISGRDGDNIASRSSSAAWYSGPTVLEALDTFAAPGALSSAPLRMPVQGVYKFTGQGDDRRIVAGTVASGRVSEGDEVVFYPSGKRTRVKSIEAFNADPPKSAAAGSATGFTLTEQIYVARGEIATRATDPPPAVSKRLHVSVFWLGRTPLVPNRDYVLKLGSARVAMRIEAIHSVMDASTLESAKRDRIERHELADCTLAVSRPIAFDLASEFADTSRFVIVDDYEIRGGGIVRGAPLDDEAGLRDKVLMRNAKWEASSVPHERRVARHAQRPTLLLITGDTDGDRRKALARELESQLFENGRLVYFLGMANLVYGIDADLERTELTRKEHLRRAAEVANIMLEAGFIFILTASDLTPSDLAVIWTSVPAERIETVWVGSSSPDIPTSLTVAVEEEVVDAARRVEVLLQDRSIVYRAW